MEKLSVTRKVTIAIVEDKLNTCRLGIDPWCIGYKGTTKTTA